MEKQLSFNRTLTLLPVVLFGLAYMAPMTVFSTYGVASEASQGMLPAAYLVALIAMMFTAYSYGQMVKAYPVAGSAYTYTQKSMNPHIGFLVGWVVLTDYLFLPMINFLVAGIYLSVAFPSIPTWIWVLLFISAITIINLLGIKLTTNINAWLISYQFLVIALFIILSFKGIADGMGTGTLFSMQPFFNPDVSYSYVLAGSAILCLSFLGFDSVTTLSEETIDAKKTIPRAVSLIALIGGCMFIFVSYIGYMVHPNYIFSDPDSAAFEIAQYIGGTLFSSMFLAGMIVLCFASALSSHASVSRLLFAMGRDSILPKKIFGHLNPQFNTPIYNIIIVGIFSLSALFIDLVTAASFINFGALVAFTFVNLSVIFHYFVRQKKRSPKESIRYFVLPLIGSLFNIWLWTNLNVNSLLLGLIWGAIGLIYLMYVTNMFRKRPPEMNLENNELSDDARVPAS